MSDKKQIETLKLSSSSANSIGKTLDSARKDNSSTSSNNPIKHLAKFAKAHYRTWVVFVVYLVVSYLLFAFSIGFNLSTRYIGQFSHDQVQYIWTLNWWPYAISHHIDPFHTTYLWHPYGTDLSFAPASVPGASLLALPITLTLGPVVSFNMLIIIGNALSAFFTFLITKYLTHSYKAGVISGLLFGFSTYQFVQEIHLHTELTFLIPLIVYLFLLFWEQKIQSLAFIFITGLCLTLQYLFAIEVFVTLALFIGTSVIVFILVYREHFKKMLYFLMNLAGSYALATLLLSPFLYTAFRNGIPTRPFNPVALFSIDPLNFIIPTKTTYLGSSAFMQLSKTFGGVYEMSGYLGIPLLVILILYTVNNWHEKLTRFLFFILVCFIILSLGPQLHIAGHSLFVLPEYIINKLPVINQLLPARLTVYVFFVASIIVGLWVGKNVKSFRTEGKKGLYYTRYLLVLLTLIFFFPNVVSGTAYTDTNIPYFFTSGMYKNYIHKGDNVLYIPYASDGDSMLYQEYTNIYFNLAEGYVTTWVLTPKIFLQNPITSKLLYRYLPRKPLTAADFPDFKKYLVDFKVNEIIFPQSEYKHLFPVVSRLNIKPTIVDGILVYKINSV